MRLRLDEKPKKEPSRLRLWTSSILTPILCFCVGLVVYNFTRSFGNPREFPNLKAAEKLLMNSLHTNHAGEWLKKYTSAAHLPGTNYDLVEFTRSKFEEFGFEASLDPYEIYVSYPRDHALHMLQSNGSVIYTAPLKEDILKEDIGSDGPSTVPTFLSYAANGNVTASFVYVNYGTKQDFEDLHSWGIDVKGKIVIARYGGIFRGLKVKFAQDWGAEGVLIYSDPADDGELTPANGYEQYPHGPARQESSVQRGSVQFLGALDATPGDPTTPGYASKKGVDRESPYQSIGSIPALPVSYREIKPILAQLSGYGHTKLPKRWIGAVEGIEYATGPAPNHTLNLYSEQDFNISTLTNVYGQIEGTIKNEVIIIGNHRDAWTSGASDPNLGSAVLLEIARALGELKDLGYVFKRTIVLQSYDGEEYGLLGSTELGEYYAKKYLKTVVAYLNLDDAFAGKRLRISASPLLKKVLLDTLQRVDHPANGTLYDHFVGEGHSIGHLGSGSDYTVFLEHLGIPSADFAFKPGKNDPIYHYHSNYDSYAWMTKFGDTDFTYHNAMAKYLSLVAFTLSNHELIPLGLSAYGADLTQYFNEVISKAPLEWLGESAEPLGKKPMEDHQRAAFAKENKQYPDPDIRHGCHARANALRYGFSERPGVHGIINRNRYQHGQGMTASDEMSRNTHPTNLTVGEVITEIRHDLRGLSDETIEFDEDAAKLQHQYENQGDLWWWERIKMYSEIRRINKMAQYFERNFLHHEGLHRRSWFKHIVFASGRYTGYAGQTLPGLREAIEDDDLDRFREWLGIIGGTLRRINNSLV